MEKKKLLKNVFNITTIIMTVLIIAFIVYGIKIGIFSDKNMLIEYMKKFGIFAPAVFIFIQIIQVIFPVIPGGASCLAGVLAFGPIGGFIYNEIGLSIGSIIAYFLSKEYGLKLINSLFKKEQVDKYLGYIRNNKFEKVFLCGIILPGLPDDLMCYVAGLSNISLKKFCAIIILGKPFALILYSLFFNVIM